ncbi:tRNA modification GTPase [Lachnospiraceae bacterium C10]|nr:tRNA modification GTPase [Lachnospiraceae bacterium C10]
MFEMDTIAALATPLSPSGIGIIRISGPEAVINTDKIFCGKVALSDAKTHTIHYGKIYDGDDVVDEVLVSVMRGPHSYTGEDVTEINCHGGVLVMKKILSLVYRLGIRPAEPGEFTKRAFLNGRLDLSQAASVMDVIEADSEAALKNSIKQLKGAFSDELKGIRDQILHETAYIEAALDDPEHYDLGIYGQTLKDKIVPVIAKLEKLSQSYKEGSLLHNGIRTAIVGRPNVGKSSLLNFLSRQERAIVSNIPGTTRDTLEESVSLGEITLHLIDTAGIRNTDDTIEKIGVDRAFASIDQADLILFLLDSSRPLSEDDKKLYSEIEEKQVVLLCNKSDLEFHSDIEEFCKNVHCPVVYFSTKTGDGKDELVDVITKMFFRGELAGAEDFYVSSERDKLELDSAVHSLQYVCQSIDDGMSEDFYTVDLMDAYSALGRILGEAVDEDLVNRIFADFCMGK